MPFSCISGPAEEVDLYLCGSALKFFKAGGFCFVYRSSTFGKALQRLVLGLPQERVSCCHPHCSKFTSLERYITTHLIISSTQISFIFLADDGKRDYVALYGSMAFHAPEQLEVRVVAAIDPLLLGPLTDRRQQDMWSGMAMVLGVLLEKDPFRGLPAEDKFPLDKAASRAVRLLESQTEWVRAAHFMTMPCPVL